MSIEIRLLDQARRVLDRRIDATSHHMKIKASFGSEFKTVSIAEMRQALTDAAAMIEQERVEAEKQAERAARIVTTEAKEKKGVCVEPGCTKKAIANGCGMCEPHFEIAGQENSHSDDLGHDGHEGDFDTCPVCAPITAQFLAMLKVKKQGAKKSSTRRGQDPMVRYADKIVSVAATSADGKKVTRVRIKCALPGCKHLREIATQDLFQVSHCSLAHKREHQKQIAGK